MNNKSIVSIAFLMGVLVLGPHFFSQSSKAGRMSSNINISGTMTSEGVECPAMRSEDGTLYTLTGDVQDLKPGDKIRIKGQLARMSKCMQGQTIVVQEVEKSE